MKIPLPCPCVSSLERCPISSSNDTHEVVKTQRSMLCKVSAESDRDPDLAPVLLSVDPCCSAVCVLSCAVTLHNTHCWMLSHQENSSIFVILTWWRSFFSRSRVLIEQCNNDVNHRGTARNLGGGIR